MVPDQHNASAELLGVGTLCQLDPEKRKPHTAGGARFRRIPSRRYGSGAPRAYNTSPPGGTHEQGGSGARYRPRGPPALRQPALNGIALQGVAETESHRPPTSERGECPQRAQVPRLSLSGNLCPVKWTNWSKLAPYPERQAVSEAWGEFIAGQGEWHVFGGLTYDADRHERMPSGDSARRHALSWLGGRLRPGGVQVEAAVVAIEHHKSGWPHLHPLLRLKGGLHPGALVELGQEWYGAHGYAQLEPPRDRLAVAAYASKYLAKDLDHGDVIFWPRRGPLSVHQPGLGAARALR